MEVSGQLHATGALNFGKEPQVTHWIGGWVGTRTGLDAVVTRIICSCQESNPDIQPAVYSLYWLSYAGFYCKIVSDILTYGTPYLFIYPLQSFDIEKLWVQRSHNHMLQYQASLTQSVWFDNCKLQGDGRPAEKKQEGGLAEREQILVKSRGESGISTLV